jgi:HD-like signal output (HDOD) protein
MDTMDNLNFDLPGISPVGLELITLLNTSQATVKQIAAQARLDPVIFGNIIACANSPMYQEANKSTDILTSLVRLGQREIKRIVYQVVLRSAFFHESAEINAILSRIWRQGLTANMFMQKFVSAAPDAYSLDDQATECLECLGLIHNIGYVVLLVNFQERFLEFFQHSQGLDLPAFFEEEARWFDGFDHFSAGHAVLEAWNFPQPVCEVVAQYGLANEAFQGRYPAMHNLLRLSRHVIMMMDSNFHPKKPADYWLVGTELPTSEVDYEEIISDVRHCVQSIEGSFS